MDDREREMRQLIKDGSDHLGLMDAAYLIGLLDDARKRERQTLVQLCHVWKRLQLDMRSTPLEGLVYRVGQAIPGVAKALHERGVIDDEGEFVPGAIEELSVEPPGIPRRCGKNVLG